MKKRAVIKSRAILGLFLLCGAVSVFVQFTRTYDIPILVLGKESVTFRGSPGGKHVAFVNYKEDYEYTQKSPPILAPLSYDYIAQLSDFNYLTRNIFLADPRTRFLESDVNVEKFLAKDFSIDTSVDGPQILIFHAHSMEMFADSNPADKMTGVVGVGRYLAEILETRYGVRVMHHTERFDMLNGIPQRPGSYERVEPAIRRILADNPSIQMVIDLHRDGVGPHVAPMVTYINGKRTAQIMLVNGLSRQYRRGEIIPLPWLPNPYQSENLAFSMNLQLAANNLYPGFARRIYLLEFRYSLHMAPQSILLEVGAQNNTLQEALNAMHPMANIIAAVVLGE
ncbi:MAG: stage II sporulation protein P [Defluviitaleaceae bacterium]|nr:stage II sporulation protein P [Defluviitaleaceae bacterium]